MPAALDLTGQKFGRLQVEAWAGRDVRGTNQWLCSCDCGGVTHVGTTQLRSGHTRSCGCLSSETTAERNYVHGLTKHPLYRRWHDMLARVRTNKRYLELGIKVCDLWNPNLCGAKAALENFIEDIEFDLGPPPTHEHSLDRHPDPFGDYEVGNLRWATKAEQQANLTTNHGLRIDPATGKVTKTYSTWDSMKRLNKGNVCPEWADKRGFVKFYADMGEKPKGSRLKRRDLKMEFNKHNCYWG